MPELTAGEIGFSLGQAPFQDRRIALTAWNHWFESSLVTYTVCWLISMNKLCIKERANAVNTGWFSISWQTDMMVLQQMFVMASTRNWVVIASQCDAVCAYGYWLVGCAVLPGMQFTIPILFPSLRHYFSVTFHFHIKYRKCIKAWIMYKIK